ncbi:MAG: S9 family peptidase, partial [Caldilinea sp.]|nr:S9 family peptidase [Caldilinea sp.]
MPFSYASDVQPPQPPRRPTRLVAHGDVRIDDYYWMRDRTSQEVLDHLAAENAYAAAVMQSTEDLQERLFQEMRGRIKETDMTAPVEDGGFWYYERTVQGLNYPIYCRRAGSMEAAEEILLDVNTLAEGHEFCEIGNFRMSTDHRLLAYSYDIDGNESYTIVVKDLATGELLADRIAGAYYGLEWAADNGSFFYTTFDAAHRPDKVWRHVLGSEQSADALVHHEQDERFFATLFKTRSGHFIVVHLRSNVTTESRVIPAAAPESAPQVISARRQGHEYYIDHRGDAFYILTNDNAEDFRIVTAPVATPGPEAWRELVSEQAGVLLDEIAAFRDHLVIFAWSGGVKRVQVLRLVPDAAAIAEEHSVSFPEESYAVYLAENPLFDTAAVRLLYASLKTPPTTYAYDMAGRTFTLLKQEEIANYNPDDYETHRLWATAPDGI